MARKFAAFDIDGTLIRWQLYHTVVNRLAKSGLLGDDARKKVHDALMRWKNREAVDSFDEYQNQSVEVYESAISNVPQNVFDEIITEVVQEYKSQVYVFTRELIKKLKNEGYFLLAISGSHHEIVGHIAKEYGFDDYVGTKYERDDNGFTGQVISPLDDKAAALRALIAKHDLTTEDSWAIGDSESDARIFDIVDHPVAFNPNRKLFEIAKEKGWKIIVERKNVVYQLEVDGDSYHLV